MKKELTRRDLIGRAGMALGGVMTFGVLQSCSSSSDPSCPAPTECPPQYPGAQVASWPYEQHLSDTYQLVKGDVQELAYHGYYTGGCCHGAYYGLMKHLADTVGQPFSLMPLNFGNFGGGGIAGYGSICGSLLGSILVVNSVVPNVPNADATMANVRNRMMVELMRWYETNLFPAYTPVAKDAAEDETKLTLAFNDSAKPAVTQVAPVSHLCHSSVTNWCAANGNVGTGSADKKARCARLTADVAGKVVDMLNGYLATGSFTAATTDPNGNCTGCHGNTAQDLTTLPAKPAPTAAGMECGACHDVTVHPLPTSPAHSSTSTCDNCH